MKKCDGNVNLSELAILAQAATEVPIGREIIEIGTFDGRTTINLAINAAAGVPLFTIDLPADRATAFALENSERRYVDKLAPGARLRSAGPAWQAYAGRIVQLLGDSAAFDWSAHSGKAGLVFVDGSHAYENVRRDTETALRLAAEGGIVFWHDYGVWPGVTRVLEELARGPRLALTHIRGTSLVYFRKAPSWPPMGKWDAPFASPTSVMVAPQDTLAPLATLAGPVRDGRARLDSASQAQQRRRSPG
jgi:predicted O-methyltransferase YrrM